MAIGEIPASLAELERPNMEYEASRFASTAPGRRLAHAQRDFFLAWFPWPPWRLGGRAISAPVEERVVELLDLARPTRAERLDGRNQTLRKPARAIRRGLEALKDGRGAVGAATAALTRNARSSWRDRDRAKREERVRAAMTAATMGVAS